MSRFARHLRLVALLVLVAVAALPAAQPAHAQTFTVNSTADTDTGACPTTCTLREAIRRANENSGPDTITFGVSGTINVGSELPPLSGGGTTIVASSHAVVLNGVGAGNAFGLFINSGGNTVRGLVIVGFQGSSSSLGGSGIFISGTAATNNVIADNWIGLNADGTTTSGNRWYGVWLADGASSNTIGGANVADRNVLTGNGRANIALDGSTGSANLLDSNQVVGNYIGVNAAGTAVPTDVSQADLAAGVFVSAYARNTLIKGNLIGGHLGNSTNAAGGIVLESSETTVNSNLHPSGTTIVANDIGVTPSGVSVANHNGIRITRGAPNTTIGDPNDPAGGRNVIGNTEEDGIQIVDVAINVSNLKIVGNYIGIARNGTTLAPIGTAGSSTLHNTGIYLGTMANGSPAPAAQIGPGNVIAAARRYGVRVRSGQNVIAGNFIGTNVAGTSTTTTDASSATVGFGVGLVGVWVENGSGNTVGGPSGADRNVIAAGSGGSSPSAVLVMPGTGCTTTCAIDATTIQGNYLGVSSTGAGALVSAASVSSEGIRLTNNSSAATSPPTNSVVRGNVISGLGTGIYVLRGVSGSTIDANQIGTGASVAQSIRNQRDGIRLTATVGSGNQITNNTISFNGDDNGGGAFSYSGINIDNLDPFGVAGSGGNNNSIVGNHMVANGDGSLSSGIYVNGPTGILISQTTTSSHRNGGIRLANGGNGGRAAPTLNQVTGSVAAATLTGSSSCAGCTVEVFTSSVDETREGPIYLTTGSTDGSGNFSINVTGCQRYLTATVRDASNNTSPFSISLDSGGTGFCVDSTFTLGVAFPFDKQEAVPGDSVIYRHSVTNNAPVARTFTIVYTSTRGWASAPSQITVPASTSSSFDLTVSVPLGATTTPTPDVDTTSVQIFAGAQGSNVVTDITTAKAVVVNPAFPAVSPGQTKTRGGTTVTFTHTVTNTGDLAGTFAVVTPAGAAGLPVFTGATPSGWSVQSATLGASSLAAGASTTLTIVVNTPAGAAAGSYPISFGVKVSGGAQSNPATVDTIVVPTVRSFSFSALAPTTRSSPPGAALSFTYLITNTGNAADSFQITPPTSTTPASTPPITNFSVNPSGSFSLAAGGVRTVTLTAQIPSGANTGNYTFSVGAQAVGGSGAPPSQSASGTITVTGGGAPTLSFSPGAPNPIGAGGGVVTFTGTLTNTGNASAPFSLGAPAVVGSPAGWSATISASSCPASLTANQSCTFTLAVTVPSGAAGGPQDVTLSATADNGAAGASPEDVTSSATATVNVATLRAAALSPASPSTQTGAPGATLSFTHILTNTGNATDSFTLSVTPSASATAAIVVLNPTSLISIPSGTARTVTLTVTVPNGVSATDPLSFRIDALPTGLPSATVSQTDTVTIAAVDGAALSPGTTKNGLPGNALTFTHTLTNTGSTAITYAITASNSNPSFTAPVINGGNPLIALAPGQTATVTIQVSLPSGPSSGAANTITVEARKSGDPTLLASATDQALVGETYGVVIAPDRNGTGYPSESLVFTHIVTNTGVTPDTYTITATNSLVWPMSVAPSTLALAPGASQTVTVTIDVPNDNSTLDGTQNFGRVRVTSNSNPATANDEALEYITIGKVIDLVLTGDQARAVTPSSGRIRMRDLTLSNFGNGSDIIDLSVDGATNGWKVDITAADFLGARQTNYNITVWVTVPTDVQPGPTKVITIRATSRFNPTVSSEVRLRFVYIAPEVQVTYKTYLPIIRR